MFYWPHIWVVFYLEWRFSWLWGGIQKTLKKRGKQTEENHWKVKRKKNEEYQESQMTIIYIFIGFKLVLSCLYLYIMKLYLQFLCVAECLKPNNDTPKLNMHKYINYNMIKIYRNRLSTTTQIFIAMDYSIIMSEKYIHFRKRQKNLAKTFFSHLL